MTDYDEFEAWSTPKSRKKRKKDAKRVNVYPRLAGGIDEIPQMLGKEPLAAEDRPEEERMTRERAEALAGEILGWLEPVTDYAEVAGSYRRGRQDPGDLDVIVILKNRVKLPEIAELWLAEGKASAVNWVGEKKTQLLIDGVKVDIRTSTPRALGAALLYFTGPAGYNIGIRSAAKRAGFKLSEYGLFNRETGEYIAGATEEEIYTAMGRNYRPPTERRAEENVSFATEENNEMQEAIIRGLRNLARDGYVVAAPPYGNRSRTFYQDLSTEIMSELAELGSDDEGPEVTGSGRAIDPYNVVRSLARNQSFSMPNNDNELSVGIADMITSFTQQSTMMDEQDGFIAPEGYTEMVFDLPGDGRITRRLAWKVATAMGIYPTAGNRLFLYSTPQKNRNCSMIVNMLLEDLSEEVAGMSVSEQEQFYQEFGQELLRQVEYFDGPIQEEYGRNREWKIRNHGDNPMVERVAVRDDIKDRAVTAAQRLNPFSAEEEEVITRSLGEIPDKELIILYQQGKISKMQMEIGFGLKMDAESYKPPASAISAAKRGLEQRKKYGRGGLSPAEAKSQGIDSGVTRARKIASGKVSKHDVRRMSAFNRHRKNNNPGKKMPDGGPTAGTIAWNLWGGTSGVNWAKKKSAAMNAEDMNAETLDYNSFTNDMEALLAKYSQLLLTYETEYQDGIMEVFTRFKPYNAYFDDVDFNAETFEAETQEFADRFEIQIRTSRGNTTERIPVGGSMLVRRLREILGRNRQPYAIDVFGTEAAFNVQGPYGMQVYRPTPKLLAVHKYGRFESGEMADHLNEKLGLNQFAAEGSKVFEAPTCLYCDEDEDGRYAEIDECSCDFCFHCGEHTYDGYELKAPYPSLHPDVRLCDACYAIPNFPISGKIWAYENYRGLATPNIYDFNQGRGWARWEHPNYQKYAKGHMGRKGKLMNELNRRVPQRTDGWVNWTRDKFEEEFRIYPWHYGYDANREPRWAYDKSEIEDRINEFYQQG